MKRFLLLVVLVLLVGCATPSRIVEKFGKDEKLTERITEYDNSTFYSGKAVGLSIGVNPESKIPEIIFRYGRYEGARIKSNMKYSSDYKLNNVNLFTGEGSASHYISVDGLPNEETK